MSEHVPPGTQPIAGPVGSETAAPTPPQQTEPPSSPATPTGVVPGEGGNSVESNALTGDGAPRAETEPEGAPGQADEAPEDESGDEAEDESDEVSAPEPPSEERLAEMLEQSQASTTSTDVVDSGLDEPVPVGTEHVVQDNVSDPDQPQTALVSGLTEQTNTESGQETSYADGGVSNHGADEPPATTGPAKPALDGSLSRGSLDPR